MPCLNTGGPFDEFRDRGGEEPLFLIRSQPIFVGKGGRLKLIRYEEIGV